MILEYGLQIAYSIFYIGCSIFALIIIYRLFIRDMY